MFEITTGYDYIEIDCLERAKLQFSLVNQRIRESLVVKKVSKPWKLFLVLMEMDQNLFKIGKNSNEQNRKTK